MKGFRRDSQVGTTITLATADDKSTCAGECRGSPSLCRSFTVEADQCKLYGFYTWGYNYQRTLPAASDARSYDLDCFTPGNVYSPPPVAIIYS